MLDFSNVLARFALAGLLASASLTFTVSAQEAEDTADETKQNTGEDENGASKGWTGPELQRIEIIGSSSQRGYAGSSFAVTKTEVDILDLAQSVSAITRDLIEDQGLQRLNDVTPFAAGVNEFSVYNDITIRGFRNSDDRRVNGMRTYNNFWSQTAIAHLERVEIIKGPGAATFGDASPGGVVNLVTKKPLPSSQREVSVGFGSFDERTAALDVTGPLNEDASLLYRLNLGWEDSDSFRNQAFNKTKTVAPSLSWLPRPGTRVNLDMVYTDAAGVLDRGQPNVRGGDNLGLVPPEVSITQPGDGMDTTDYSINLTFDQDLGSRWAFTFSHMLYRYEEHLREHRISNRYLSDNEVELSFIDRDSDADVNATTAYITGDFETGGVMHQLVFGVDHAKREDFQEQMSATGVGVFDVLNPEYFRRDVDSYDLAVPAWAPWATNLDTTGYYIHDQVEIGDWIVLGGLRYDQFDSSTISGGELTPTDDNSQLSPRLSVTYRLDNDRRLYASWITGFEPEAGWTEFDGGPFDPSDSQLFEIGYKQRAFDDRLLLTASIYELTKNNIVVYANDPDDPNLYRQRGQERSRGFEIEANGEITEQWRLVANYAYNDTEVTEDADPSLIGARAENAPRHMATIWTRYNLGNGFGIGGGVSHVSERETFESDLRLPSYTLINAGIYYTVGQVRLALLGRNLTDREHWTGGYNFGRVFPGDPRSVRLSVRYQF